MQLQLAKSAGLQVSKTQHFLWNAASAFDRSVDAAFANAAEDGALYAALDLDPCCFDPTNPGGLGESIFIEDFIVDKYCGALIAGARGGGCTSFMSAPQGFAPGEWHKTCVALALNPPQQQCLGGVISMVYPPQRPWSTAEEPGGAMAPYSMSFSKKRFSEHFDRRFVCTSDAVAADAAEDYTCAAECANSVAINLDFVHKQAVLALKESPKDASLRAMLVLKVDLVDQACELAVHACDWSAERCREVEKTLSTGLKCAEALEEGYAVSKKNEQCLDEQRLTALVEFVGGGTRAPAEATDPMQCVVVMPAGHKITFDARASDTFQDIKIKILDKTNELPEDQLLFCKGAYLYDGLTRLDYDMTADDIVCLTVATGEAKRGDDVTGRLRKELERGVMAAALRECGPGSGVRDGDAVRKFGSDLEGVLAGAGRAVVGDEAAASGNVISAERARREGSGSRVGSRGPADAPPGTPSKSEADADAVGVDVCANDTGVDVPKPVVQVFLKHLTGKTVTLEVHNCTTIYDVKGKIEAQEGVPRDAQRLICKSVQLDDASLVVDCLEKGKNVTLVLRLFGGAAEGTAEWWAAHPDLNVQTAARAFDSTPASRQAAHAAKLGPDWNKSETPRGRGGQFAYWHTKAPTLYTTSVELLRRALGATAPARKSTSRGFSNPSTLRHSEKQKVEQTGKYDPNYKSGGAPGGPEARIEAYYVQIYRNAKVGRRVGASNGTRSEMYTCGYIGELFALQYVGLFNPQVRPLVCYCELWWLLERHGIECEFERWYGWMEDMWWCGNGSLAGSGGVAGRLGALGLGTFDNRDAWPTVNRTIDMERVADLLGLPKASAARQHFHTSVDAFKVTYLVDKPGRAAYTMNHAARPAWWSRTSCWHRLAMTCRNKMRPEDQIFPGRLASVGPRTKPAPNGKEWFAGPGPWCLGPTVSRTVLLRIDGHALAPADFAGSQHTIVMMSLASLYDGRPMYIEVKWHREKFTGDTATIALAHYLIGLAQSHPKLKYAIPEGNALKCASSLVNSGRDQRARGMWIVVSDYLRKEGCLDVWPEGLEGSTDNRQPWTWPLAGLGDRTIELPWCPVDWNHGEPHGLPDDVAEEDVHDAYRYDRFQADAEAFINSARDVENTYWALTDDEAKAPMKCFPDGNVTAFRRREPPHRVRPEYADLKVEGGLVVFTLPGLHGCSDADVLLMALEDYRRVKHKLVARCWRHWAGNLNHMSKEFEERVKEAVETRSRSKDEDLLETLAVGEASEAAAEDAAAEDDSGPGDDDDPMGLDVVVDYLDGAGTLTDLKTGDRVDGNWENGGVWFPATVTRVCGGDAYDVDYDAGAEEKNLPTARLRQRAARTSKLFFQGGFVMANYEGRGVEHKALLWKRSGVDGFDLIYSDGAFESCVPVSRMRRVRESDSEAVRELTFAHWSDPATKLTKEDLEKANYRELEAACGCRGGIETGGKVQEIKERLWKHLGFDANHEAAVAAGRRRDEARVNGTGPGRILPGLGIVNAWGDPFALELAFGACQHDAWARLGAAEDEVVTAKRRHDERDADSKKRRRDILDTVARRRAALRPLAKWRALHRPGRARQGKARARASLELWPALVGEARPFDAATSGSNEACVVAGCLAHALSRALSDAGASASVDLSALKQVAKDSSTLVMRALGWSVEDFRVVLDAASQVHNVTALVGLTKDLEFATRRNAVPVDLTSRRSTEAC